MLWKYKPLAVLWCHRLILRSAAWCRTRLMSEVLEEGVAYFVRVSCWIRSLLTSLHRYNCHLNFDSFYCTETLLTVMLPWQQHLASLRITRFPLAGTKQQPWFHAQNYSPDTYWSNSYKTLPPNAIKMKEIQGLWKRQKCNLNTLFFFLGEFVSSFDITVLICHKAHIKLEFNDEILCHWSSGGSVALQWTITGYAQRNLLWQHHFASLYHLRKQRVNWSWKSRLVFEVILYIFIYVILCPRTKLFIVSQLYITF